MRKKSVVLILMSLVAVFGLSGCLDLFSVPGVAISPDGQTLYFLGGPTFDMTSSSTGTGNASLLMKLDRATGTAETVLGDDTSFVSAFDVNPANGDVAVVVTGQDGATRLVLYNQAAGPRDLTTALAPQSAATSLQFSPDGQWIAASILTVPPELSFDQVSSESMTPEQVQLIDSGVVLINVSDGSIKQVSDPAAEFANTIVWSPNGQYIAYNSWVDSNADGMINTSGGLTSMMSGTTTASDVSQIRVYDVNGGTVTNIESTTMGYSPVFLDDNRVAYLSLDAGMMMMGGVPTVQVYDIGAGSSTQVYKSQGMIMGLALSPDGSQVAWTETSSESNEDGTSPVFLFVSDTNFSAPSQLADVTSSIGFADVPVWLPDGSGLLVTSTNIFSSMMGGLMGMGAAFGEAAEGMGAEGVEELPPGQQIVLVDTASGTETVLYEGYMLNSNYFASILSLVADPAAMEGMFETEGQ